MIVVVDCEIVSLKVVKVCVLDVELTISKGTKFLMTLVGVLEI